MGVAYYPEFERKIRNYDPSIQVCGKPVAHAIDRLEEICKQLGIATLMSFHSESLKEGFALIGEPFPPGMKDKSPIRWSQPKAGLKTVSALIEYLKDHPKEVKDSESVCEDLESFQRVLEKAQKHEVRFRLRLDM